MKIDRKKWLTTKEACILVDRTRTTINTWVQEESVKVIYVDHKPFFYKEDLLKTKKQKECFAQKKDFTSQ